MATTSTAPNEDLPAPAPVSSTRHSVAGLLAAAAALGVSELLSAVFAPGSSLVVNVGDVVIDFSPPAVKDWAISLFGTLDKVALVVGTLVLAALFGAALGRLAVNRFWIAASGFAAFAALGAFAAGRDLAWTVPEALLTAVLSGAVGIAALGLLTPRATAAGLSPELAEDRQRYRRAFLIGSGAIAGVAVVGWAGGRRLLTRARAAVAATRTELELPDPVRAAPEPSAAASFDVPGLTPIVVPNDEFYRIDTALIVPRVDPLTWTLKISGMVDRPTELTFEDLLNMPMVERYVTLSCVSNRVGGDLVGNALWMGVPLTELLDTANVQDGATQIVGRSVDGFTVGFPTEAAYDGREALVAVGMNGEPLPFDHGFPARLVVAGLYGYVSATKWLEEIELTTLEGFDAYWIPRGWSKEAPIKTQSRIDVPRNGAKLEPGMHPVAGVAWAPNVGITRVEVRVDEGPWEEAEISQPLSEDSWVQWRHEWEATGGVHVLYVRATDAAGVTQTEERVSPRPDGATGHHFVRVESA